MALKKQMLMWRNGLRRETVGSQSVSVSITEIVGFFLNEVSIINVMAVW